jgi:glycosyltransferase involved in cell wall biosynthesis
MKLGVVVQAGSTGAWRYTERLIDGLLQGDHVNGITIFFTTHYLHEIATTLKRWPSRVQTIHLAPPKNYTRIKCVRLLQKKIERELQIETPSDKNRKHLERCDVLFYPWPYYETAPTIDKPIVFIPHDLTYTRNFGTTLAGPTLAEFQWQFDLHKTWFDKATCIVSSSFVRSEIRRLFGDHQSPEVIPLSRFSAIGRLPENQAFERIRRIGIKGRYLLCVNNLCAHKNLGQLLGGYYLVKEKYPDLQLILAGTYSEGVSGIADNPYGVALTTNSNNQDVRGLGLVSDEDLIALMQCSEMVINPSLSEANNGPGLDAWDIGVPVAMSNIPPFLEHLEFLGVRAELFHPRCIFEIRNAIDRLLSNQSLARENASISATQMKKWTWSDICDRYATIFRNVYNSR